MPSFQISQCHTAKFIQWRKSMISDKLNLHFFSRKKRGVLAELEIIKNGGILVFENICQIIVGNLSIWLCHRHEKKHKRPKQKC